MPRMNFVLQYGTIVVGSVVEAFQSDDTWFGKFLPRPPPQSNSALHLRLLTFIAFCRDWHSRLASGLEPNATEFDSFRDILASGLWQAVGSDGAIRAIREAPVFIGADISWRLG
jgi:hypothetical protein